MTREDYEFIRTTVYDFSRINLGADKQELVNARIGKRLRDLNLQTVSQYCELLRTPNGKDEMTNLIDVISTNHTYFFREPAHFDFLKSTVLPKFFSGTKKNFRGWSAACSSGEEVYTISLVLAEALGGKAGYGWQLEATDISTRILRRAKDAIYSTDGLSKVSPELLKRYFQQGHGPQAGNFRVKPDLANRVTFRHLNLLGPPYPFTEPFDVIFCRNVMIYFDRATQEELVNRLARHLVPGGFLCVGHSESLTGIQHKLKMVRPATYQLVG